VLLWQSLARVLALWPVLPEDDEIQCQYSECRIHESWTNRYDPIARLKRWLERKGLWNDEMDKEARTSIRKAILAELTAANEKEKKPPLESIFEDVHAELSEEMQGQREELRRLMTKYPAEYDFNEHKGGLEAL
jgi:2-oxoisovalerate dehydrogenase E1 component alpha subunit